MTKQIHTHRAHCQLCASVQAIDVATGIIAKHGYTVAHGYFAGTCPGSDRLNLSVERTLADQYIAKAKDEAYELGDALEGLRDGRWFPEEAFSGKYVRVPAPTRGWPNRMVDQRVMVPYVSATDEQKAEAVRIEGHRLENRIKACTDYAKDLTTWADRINGKVDPYLVKDLEPRDWVVGDSVRIGGKAGFDAVIQTIAQKSYTTFGFRRGRGTVMCDHALVTRPAVTEKRVSEKAGGYVTREARPAADIWVAVRDIKRPANKLAEELKKAGKL